MKPRHRLALACLILFAISHLLPALSESRGYECFLLCVGVLKSPPTSLGDSGGWLYYSGFVFSNATVLVLACLSLTQRRLPLSAAITMTIFTLHVVSWPILNLATIADIKIGYYVWLAAYLVLTVALFKYPGNQTPAS